MSQCRNPDSCVHPILSFFVSLFLIYWRLTFSLCSFAAQMPFGMLIFSVCVCMSFFLTISAATFALVHVWYCFLPPFCLLLLVAVSGLCGIGSLANKICALFLNLLLFYILVNTFIVFAWIWITSSATVFNRQCLNTDIFIIVVE